MQPGEIIAVIAVCLIIGGAAAYIIKAKKNGAKCIGCPDSATCGKKGKDCRCHDQKIVEEQPEIETESGACPHCTESEKQPAPACSSCKGCPMSGECARKKERKND